MQSNEERTNRFAAVFCDWLEAIVCAVLLCVVIFSFVIKPFTVVGSSMEPTYVEGNRVLVVLPVFGYKSGDVVITDSSNFTGDSMIKRVVATEFQYVTMDEQTGEIYVDGVPFDSPIPASDDNLRGNIQYPFYVPEGTVFVMGDNRKVSYDSRYTEIGFISVRCIIGKVAG